MSTPGAALAGTVRLTPGQPLPTVHSSRPTLIADRLARGRPADELPGLLGAVFTLCSHAHRLTAQHAVQAARGDAASPGVGERVLLQAATAREQVLRITHDWPRLLPGMACCADAALLLRSCPLWRDDLNVAAQLEALPAWLAHRWLGQPLQRWLQQHDDAPETWARDWCERVDTPPARLLRKHAVALQDLATPQHALRLLDDPLATMPELARRMAADARFCAEPDWRGRPADTGPWTRAVDAAAPAADNAWMRLIARFVDVLRLAAPTGADRLAQGALPLGGGAGIAWTEMARGLLVHWVQLEPSPTGLRVADCRVLAPTEWNFHPRGLLAQTLAGLRGADATAQAARAAVAFDPCVEFSVDAASTTLREPAHA